MDTRTFYGPHACSECGALICKASFDEGGEEFDYPQGPIYPNTQWQAHVHRPVSERGPQRPGESQGAPTDPPA